MMIKLIEDLRDLKDMLIVYYDEKHEESVADLIRDIDKALEELEDDI